MSDGEDDYLSDKFLATLESNSKSSSSKTYSQLRQEATRKAELKNVAGRKKSRKEIEEESRREGLSTSLFERERARSDAQGDENEESAGPSKALKMMLKMGFKEGESLGKRASPANEVPEKESPAALSSFVKRDAESGHLVEPLPVTLWAGRKGLGMGKRLLSTDESVEGNRPSKLLKIDEASLNATAPNQVDYRNRAKEEYEERKTFGRLASAKKTLVQLDEDNDVKFNILCIDPQNPSETIPKGLLARLEDLIDPRLLSASASDDAGRSRIVPGSESDNRTQAERLKAQMRADALVPLSAGLDVIDEPSKREETASEADKSLDSDFDDETVQDARDWLMLTNKQRLQFTLDHLRKTYHYCFWCGTKYASADELEQSCPGEDEESHD
ncbi:hypothetical protein FRC03_006465 [Tulasnella sp. 419]|nr:hypothetical protein FRC02_004559 [Tulasnella sp. 418]KAG8960508.1 hypothetical protein FRC03_006465 [Tulasnella sp. 419]